MLRTMDIILNKAKEEGYGVPAPNVFNQDTIEAAINVASKMRSPIIIDFGEMVDDGSIYEIGQIVKFYSNKFPEVPVALNLDHGKTFESAARAIRAGFTSVMVDRSELPFNENVRETKEICKMAHASGLSVELKNDTSYLNFFPFAGIISLIHKYRTKYLVTQLSHPCAGKAKAHVYKYLCQNDPNTPYGY
jgi:fructose/tagatose bisphosphate aldolase